MKKNKKLLLVGGSHADIPMILAAKELGYYIITSGNRPDTIGHKHSDEYQNVDFSDKEAVYELAKKLEVEAICSSCNDFSALSVAYAAEKLGLPGHDKYEISEIIHHKDKYREFAIKNGIDTPLAKGFDNEEEAVNNISDMRLPLIVKPVDMTGGKGISVIRDIKEVREAINKAFYVSKAKRVVVEEFIEGTRHGFSAFLYKGKIAFYFTDNEHYYINQYMVSGASSPSSVLKSAEEKLCKDSEIIAELLGLVDGIFHVQFILRDRKPIIIEICRRPPGDLYVKLVKYATGVDYPSYIVKAEAGIDCGDLRYEEPKGYYLRHCIMSDREGIIKDVVYDESIKENIIEDMVFWKKGDILKNKMTDKLAIVFLKFDNENEYKDKVEKINELIRINFQR